MTPTQRQDLERAEAAAKRAQLDYLAAQEAAELQRRAWVNAYLTLSTVRNQIKAQDANDAETRAN